VPTLADFSLRASRFAAVPRRPGSHRRGVLLGMGPAARGFTVAAPVCGRERSRETTSGIVRAPVMPRISRWPTVGDHRRGRHEAGHWLYLLQLLDDQLQSKLRTQSLHPWARMNALGDSATEVFPDFFAASHVRTRRRRPVRRGAAGDAARQPDASPSGLPGCCASSPSMSLSANSAPPQASRGARPPYLLSQTSGTDCSRRNSSCPSGGRRLAQRHW